MPVHDVHWEITNACNLRCLHCVQCSGAPRTGELNPDEAVQIIDRLAAAGVQRICWTGGEPFVRRDFATLLQQAHQAGIVQAVITNGYLVRQGQLMMLQQLAIPLGVSLDATTAELHDALRGDGSFDRAMQTIVSARAQAIPVTLYATVTRGNIHELPSLIALAKHFDCGIHVNEVSLAGRAEAIWPRLALNEALREQLTVMVADAAREHFGETPEWAPDGCWADGSAVYLRSDGQVFLCSEQVQYAHSAALGHILEHSLDELLQTDLISQCSGSACSYRVLSSPRVTMIINQPIRCPLVSVESKLETLDALNQALDALYAPFADVCVACQDKCCQGFVWLMPEELTRLQQCEVDTVEVNDAASFIHSFPEKEDGSIDVSVPSPLCSQLCSLQPRRCRVYADRPFSCRLYPIGLEVREDGMLVWALHQDCQITRYLGSEGLLEEFERRALQILDSMCPELYASIIEAYRKVHILITFPLGGNNIRTLKEVVKLVKV
ncbi:MAG: radical SAM protein [Candidatus Kerfeldbacteria bacterium]|nr:radical SAM protein [Candidatus Kerfeldbacteria bacterium]